jgi:exosome complex RNA-binding protein Rrp4
MKELIPDPVVQRLEAEQRFEIAVGLNGSLPILETPEKHAVSLYYAVSNELNAEHDSLPRLHLPDA